MSGMPQPGFGAELRQRREALGLTLNDMAVRTRVHKTYLQALEDENLRLLPGTAYAIGFLRIYARELGLPVAPLLAALRGGVVDESDDESPAANDSFRRTLPRRRKGAAGRTLTWLFLLVLAAAGYYSWQINRSPSAPPIKPDVTGQPLPSDHPPVVAEPSPLTSGSPQTVVPSPPAPAPGQQTAASAAIEFPAIPPGGAVVRMIPTAPGLLKVSLDNQEIREYQLQPDQALNWKVSHSLACELSAPGLLRLWIGENELAVAEHTVFTLTAGSQPDRRP